MRCIGVLAVECRGKVRIYRRRLDPTLLRLCEACVAAAERLGVPLVEEEHVPEWVRRAWEGQLPAKEGRR